ncbi:hypothetical protein P9112_008749 [Eukaryota sp. TZLM1-RC]
MSSDIKLLESQLQPHQSVSEYLHLLSKRRTQESSFSRHAMENTSSTQQAPRSTTPSMDTSLRKQTVEHEITRLRKGISDIRERRNTIPISTPHSRSLSRAPPSPRLSAMDAESTARSARSLVSTYSVPEPPKSVSFGEEKDDDGLDDVKVCQEVDVEDTKSEPIVDCQSNDQSINQSRMIEEPQPEVDLDHVNKVDQNVQESQVKSNSPPPPPPPPSGQKPRSFSCDFKRKSHSLPLRFTAALGSKPWVKNRPATNQSNKRLTFDQSGTLTTSLLGSSSDSINSRGLNLVTSVLRNHTKHEVKPSVEKSKLLSLSSMNKTVLDPSKSMGKLSVNEANQLHTESVSSFEKRTFNDLSRKIHSKARASVDQRRKTRDSVKKIDDGFCKTIPTVESPDKSYQSNQSTSVVKVESDLSDSEDVVTVVPQPTRSFLSASVVASKGFGLPSLPSSSNQPAEDFEDKEEVEEGHSGEDKVEARTGSFAFSLLESRSSFDLD